MHILGKIRTFSLRRYLRLMTRLMLLSVAGILIWGVMSRVFTIDTVEVIGEGVSVAIPKERFPTNLLLFPSTQVEKELLDQYPFLAAVNIEKRYPKTLVVKFKRRAPVAILKSSSNLYTLDAVGFVVGINEAGVRLPLLEFEVGSFGFGAKVESKPVSQSLSFIAALSQTTPLERVEAFGDSALRVSVGSIDIFLPQNGDLGAKAATLQTIIAGFRIKGTLPKVIDLRFEKPIIRN